MCDRAQNRVAFGEALSQKTSVQHEIARSRCDIAMPTLGYAEKMDSMELMQQEIIFPLLRQKCVKMFLVEPCKFLEDGCLPRHSI